jgi:perosamine synthetase
MMESYLPYGRQFIDEEDIESVVEALRSAYLTTGPKVSEFETALRSTCKAEHAVAFANGTAALHAAMYAINIGCGDEVIVPAMTFAATANCVTYQRGTPIFADVEAGTLLIDPVSVESLITPRTKAIIAVDYAGQPCDWASLKELARRHKLLLIADSCHAIGGEYYGQSVGTIADITVFSFHPVKHVTTGEGGAALTADPELATRMRLFRNHGISTDAAQREATGEWFYEMVELGFNYRLTDIQCALGLTQLKKLPGSIAKRNELASLYTEALKGTSVRPLEKKEGIVHAYHLYVVRTPDRDRLFKLMRENRIGCNVHYIPVHLHPYYKKQFKTKEGMCPVAEEAFREILTLPLFPQMTEDDVSRVLKILQQNT